MITLTCTNCRGRLEMDDAFAGGVCRCMYCGTIQTVPSHLKRPGAARKVKALYKQNPRPLAAGGNVNGAGMAPGTNSPELDQLASAVAGSGLAGSAPSGSGLAGSGLSGSGLPSPRIRAETIAPPRRSFSQKLAAQRTILIAAAGAVCSLVLLAVLLFAFSGNGPSDATAPTIASTADVYGRSAPAPTPRQAHVEPNFCGVSLDDDRVVIYVLDRGSATGELFGDLKEACYRSVQSLGAERKFQIIFWNNGSEDECFPRNGTTFASAANLHAARTALQDVHAHGQSDVTTALAKAFAAKPDAIVLATGKAYEPDESLRRAIERMRAASGGVKIYTFALGGQESALALRQLARESGGAHRALSAARLRQYAQ